MTVAMAGLMTFLSPASTSAAPPSARDALALRPVQQGVEYQQVSDSEAANCEVSDIEIDGWSGWEVLSPDGTLLRRFADTDQDKKIDIWCYFNLGVEVYRDVDSNSNGKADQYRWLGTGGTRWAMDNDEDGRIDQWKRISAEEVSAELVAALRDETPERFTRLLATPSDLRSSGVGPDKSKTLVSRMERAAKEFLPLARRQKVIGPDAEWVQFAAPAPGVVPAGVDGATKDLVVYENVVAMFDNDGQPGQLLVGSMIQVGDAWRLLGLPSIGAGGEAVAQSPGVFFSPGTGSAGSPAAMGADDATQELVTRLEKIDRELSAATAASAPKLHAQRADLVEELIAASGNPTDRETWTRQLVDTVSVATQSGKYPGGLERLQKVASSYAKGNQQLAAYADFQAITTEYQLRGNEPKADFQKLQEWYLDELGDFVRQYPRTPESGQAMLQLALSKEFEDNEKEALDYYKVVAKDFAGTDAGKKAAGAVRRLESIGQRVDLEGTTMDGKTFRLSAFRGRPIVLHYWATWCEPCKKDMVVLRGIQARYKRAGLTLVGINVDASREDAAAFLKQNPLTWIQLFEDGGLESSPLSNAFGVQTLPTMMLIDKNGKMVRHNVRAAELDDELAKLTK